MSTSQAATEEILKSGAAEGAGRQKPQAESGRAGEEPGGLSLPPALPWSPASGIRIVGSRPGAADHVGIVGLIGEV